MQDFKRNLNSNLLNRNFLYSKLLNKYILNSNLLNNPTFKLFYKIHQMIRRLWLFRNSPEQNKDKLCKDRFSRGNTEFAFDLTILGLHFRFAILSYN